MVTVSPWQLECASVIANFPGVKCTIDCCEVAVAEEVSLDSLILDEQMMDERAHEL